MNIKGTIKSITNIYKKISTLGKILLFMVFLLVMLSFFRSNNKSLREGFDQSSQFIFKKGPEIYDNFYANVYDSLINTDISSDFEIGDIINSTNPSSESIILDVGCGTGSCVSKLSDSNLQVIGVDVSPFMIKKSIMKYPDYKFVVGDALNIGVFSPGSFTHILCLDHIIYYFKDKRQFFNNCMDWLMPGGFLFLHVVEREKMNPVLNKNTKKTKYNDFDYIADFQQNGDNASINEKFKFKNGKTRKQEQTLYIEDKETILTIVQQCGFILHGIGNVVKSSYGDQYIYIFVKA